RHGAGIEYRSLEAQRIRFMSLIPNKKLGREPFRYTRAESASGLLEVCYEPYDSGGESRCAVVSIPVDRAGPSGSAKIGGGPLSGVVHYSGSTTIRSSARDAAQLLVSA